MPIGRQAITSPDATGGAMSGHSKWSQIKRQKGAADTKRGMRFTKLAREIIVAVRQGSADPESNARLRLAIARAREENMPLDNIERAIKKGSGEGGEGAALEEVTYEGYGPGGAAILVQALTDNRNRTVAEVRSAFTRHSGSLGEAGSVGWLFEGKGVITLHVPGATADDLALLAIDAGAEDVEVDDGTLEVRTPPERLEQVRVALAGQAPIASAELAMVPKTSVPLDERTSMQTLRLLDHLEDLDDVQRVYCNADFPNEALARLAG